MIEGYWMARSTPKPYIHYSDELAEEICAAIEHSHLGLKALCKEHKHWPPARTIRRWLTEPEHTLFQHQYARAKNAQTENLVEQIIEIAHDDSRDVLSDSDGGLHGNNAAINRDKLKIDSIKWIAAKLIPRKYGKNEDDDQSPDDFISKNRDKF